MENLSFEKANDNTIKVTKTNIDEQSFTFDSLTARKTMLIQQKQMLNDPIDSELEFIEQLLEQCETLGITAQQIIA